MSPAKWIIIFSNVPILISCIYALGIYTKLSNSLKVFSWFIVLSTLVQLSSLVLWCFGKNNMPFLHAYVALGFICLGLFYKEALMGLINGRIITAVIVIFVGYSIFNSVFIQSVFTFNSYALTAESVIIIIFALSTYLLFMDEAVIETSRSSVTSINWINSGLFIYYTSNILLSYFGSIIMGRLPLLLSRYTWMLHSVFITIMYLCFIIGLWKRPRE